MRVDSVLIVASTTEGDGLGFDARSAAGTSTGVVRSSWVGGAGAAGAAGAAGRPSQFPAGELDELGALARSAGAGTGTDFMGDLARSKSTAQGSAKDSQKAGKKKKKKGAGTIL